MSNITNILLKIDAQKVELPTKEFEIKRLTELAGEKVVFKLRALTQKQFEEVQEMSTDIDVQNQTSDVDVSLMQLETILNGVASPSLRDKEVMDHYGVVTPYDLIKKLLLPGEISSLYDQISRLSAFNTGAVEEVKKQ